MAQVSEPSDTSAPAAPTNPVAAPSMSSGELQALREQADRGEAYAQHQYGVRLWNGTDGSRKDEVEVCQVALLESHVGFLGNLHSRAFVGTDSELDTHNTISRLWLGGGRLRSRATTLPA